MPGDHLRRIGDELFVCGRNESDGASRRTLQVNNGYRSFDQGLEGYAALQPRFENQKKSRTVATEVTVAL
jgi:hypothetical protein